MEESTQPPFPEWPFPEGPKVCPLCGGPTVVGKTRLLQSGSCSPKGGGKAVWSIIEVRRCEPCCKKIQDESREAARAGQMFDLEELLAALKEDREPRMECELHPEKYP